MVRLVTHDQRDAHDEESRNPILAEWWPIAALGATTGLASLAKVSGLGLVVLAALVLVYVSLKRGDNHLETSTTPGPGPGLLIFRLVVFGAAVVLVAGWWYLRNLNLYGELTGTAMMVRIFGARTTPLTTDQLLTQLREVWETFWVGFGWGNIRAQPWVYTTLEILVAASGIGLLLGLARRREHIRETLVRAAPLFVLALWIVIAFVELLNWMEMTQAPHGRLFFPALPALGPLAVFGLTQLFPRRAQTLVLRGAAVGQLAFAALASVLILEPAYAFPAFASQAPAVSQPVKVNFDNKMELLGYDVSPNRTRPGEAVTLTLYWQSLAAMDEDYSIGIHLVDSGGRAIGARDSYPGHGLLPTRLWQPGQILRDPYWLPVSGDAIPSSIGRIEVSLYSLSDRRALPAFDPAGNSLATPVVGRLKISGTGTPAVIPRSGQAYSFGKTIDLLGEDIQTTRAGENGQNVSLTLYWKRAAPVELDYAVFVHILDAKGKIVTQKDQEPAGGEDPTSLWDENEIVPDRYAFALPSGDYTIELGLYNAQSGERLPVTDARENPLGDHITFPLGVKP